MRRTMIAIGIVLALAAPTALAAWRGPGSAEPDTPHDLDGPMWRDPDTSPTGSRVYFDGFQALPQTSLNPNSGALGSRIQPAPMTHHRAVLGVWKDCNRDGYIGMAEAAVQDYVAALLVDASVCPPTAYVGTPVHNDGRWVSELLTIGRVDPCEFEEDAAKRARECPGVLAFALNERVLYDNASAVWADAGTPGAPPAHACPVAPLPRGTTASTGALVGYADCQSQRGIVHAINAADADGALGLRFDDPRHPETSSSRLNQRMPVALYEDGARTGLLQDDAERGAFTAWDCSRPRGGADARDPTGLAPHEVVLTDPSGGRLTGPQFPQVILGVYFVDHDEDPATPGVLRVPLARDGSYAWAPAPAPALDDEPAGASWWTALARAADGPMGDCDAATGSPIDGLYVADAVEGPHGFPDGLKDRVDLTFAFYDGHRGLNPNVDRHVGDTTPSDGGTFWLDHDRGGDGPLWSALAPREEDPQIIHRADLQPAPARWFTYYAYVGEAVAQRHALPPGAVGLYGSEACGATFSGERNGWQCDASRWWRGAGGEDLRPRYARGEPLGRLPGDAWRLRDVDCHDGTLVDGAPLRASLVDLSMDGACPATAADERRALP